MSDEDTVVTIDDNVQPDNETRAKVLEIARQHFGEEHAELAADWIGSQLSSSHRPLVFMQGSRSVGKSQLQHLLIEAFKLDNSQKT
ncbi:MAG TPA: hypothetical protein PK857_06925 [Hyphomicrobium sp.]|nr:hypothetical protein [Hyphomicrobium sp.]HRO48753.1 hypothetical protein [Hyphomicrobium sp.]